MTEYTQQTGYFAAGDVPTGKFMALFNDGSGGRIFMAIDGGYMRAEEGDTVDFDYFLDAGYLMWVSIPDSYKLWCEND